MLFLHRFIYLRILILFGMVRLVNSMWLIWVLLMRLKVKIWLIILLEMVLGITSLPWMSLHLGRSLSLNLIWRRTRIWVVHGWWVIIVALDWSLRTFVRVKVSLAVYWLLRCLNHWMVSWANWPEELENLCDGIDIGSESYIELSVLLFLIGL